MTACLRAYHPEHVKGRKQVRMVRYLKQLVVVDGILLSPSTVPSLSWG